MLLLTVILLDILAGAEIDLFIASFPELKAEFNLSHFFVETLLSVNFIGYCASLLYVGPLADRYGRKNIILLGLLIFTLGSIFCVFAPSFTFLLFGRLLQGIGVAAPSSLCFVIVADSYPLKQQQYLLSMLNVAINITIAVAPIIGSYITMYFHWQGNFSALLILGLIVLMMSIIFIPKYRLPANKESLSLKGYIPIVQSKNLLLLVTFLVCTSVPYWLFLAMSSILYIEDLKVSLENYGFYQGGWALIYAAGSLISGPIIKRYETGKLLYISIYCYALSLAMILLVTIINTSNPLTIALSFLPYSVASIIPATILYPLFLGYIPQLKGRLSSYYQALRLVVTAISIEIASYYYAGSFQNIGIIICLFIGTAIISLFIIVRNRKVIKLA